MYGLGVGSYSDAVAGTSRGDSDNDVIEQGGERGSARGCEWKGSEFIAWSESESDSEPESLVTEGGGLRGGTIVRGDATGGNERVATSVSGNGDDGADIQILISADESEISEILRSKAFSARADMTDEPGKVGVLVVPSLLGKDLMECLDLVGDL